MRILALDVGRRRTGLAVSDPSGTLARPLAVVEGPDVLDRVVHTIEAFARDDEAIDTIVVGYPRRLDGGATPFASEVEAFVAALRTRVAVPIVLVDERLSSRTAESLLAERLLDWRERKQKLDAAAAAVMLQEYLDARGPAVVSDPD